MSSALRRIAAGTILHRIHRVAHGPIFFGPAGSAPEQRYDAPDGAFKTLYLARSLETAFGETLVRLPSIPYVLSSDVEVRCRSELITSRPLRLFPLVDAGVSSLGLSFTDLHGAAYARTWEISGQIHSRTPADGILYTSRFDNKPCIDLFDRAQDAVVETAVRAVPIPPEQAAMLCHHYGKTYVEP